VARTKGRGEKNERELSDFADQTRPWTETATMEETVRLDPEDVHVARRRRDLMRCLRGLVVAAVLVGAAPAASAAPTPMSAEAQRQDLELVRTDYLSKEMAYTPETLRLAAAKIDALEARAGQLTPADLLVGLAEIAALADNAHSGAHYGAQARPTERLPLRFLWFPDGLYVARASGEAADLAGGEVLRVEGRTPDELYERVKVLFGGKAVDRHKRLTEFMEDGGVLHAMGLATEADAVILTVRLPSGRVVSRRVAMIPQASQGPTAGFERLWSPEPAPKEAGWRPALTPEALPLYLRDADRPFRSVPLPEQRAFYVQFRSNEDEDGYPIAPFLMSTTAELEANRPQNLIVDLRFDIGGNLLTSIDFMRRLPTMATQRVYLLVGPYTFSAGIISAAALKKAGGEKVTVVGDQVGDRPQFWSEGGLVRLPNSAFAMRYTDGQFDLEHGCASKPRCMDHYVDVNGVSLTPQIEASLTAKAWFAKRDPAMESVFARIAASR
jgi:hypothetical protein